MWKPSMNLCMLETKKKQKSKGGKNKGQVRTITQQEPKQSFFQYFSEPIEVPLILHSIQCSLIALYSFLLDLISSDLIQPYMKNDLMLPLMTLLDPIWLAYPVQLGWGGRRRRRGGGTDPHQIDGGGGLWHRTLYPHSCHPRVNPLVHRSVSLSYTAEVAA